MHLKATKLFFILMIVFISCDSLRETESGTSNNKKESPEKVYSFESIRKVAENCTGNCTTVELKYPLPANNRMKSEIEKVVKSEIGSFVRKERGLKTIADYCDEFISDYDAFKKQFPEVVTPWSLKIEGEVSHETNSWTCFKIEIEAYTGGAHGNSVTKYIVLNEKGQTMFIKDLVSDVESITILAEKAFRKVKGIGSETAWSDTDFYFEENEFQLPENIGFNSSGMIIYYNNYDISSYAEGSTEIMLPFSQIKDYLK